MSKLRQNETLAKVATSGAVLTVLGGLMVLGGKNADPTPSGEPDQRDPKTPVVRVSTPVAGISEARIIAKDHHPAPSYDSGQGPDGRLDMLAHKIVESSDGSHWVENPDYHDNRVDGGTPAPAPEHPQPTPEHPEK